MINKYEARVRSTALNSNSRWDNSRIASSRTFLACSEMFQVMKKSSSPVRLSPLFLGGGWLRSYDLPLTVHGNLNISVPRRIRGLKDPSTKRKLSRMQGPKLQMKPIKTRGARFDSVQPRYMSGLVSCMSHNFRRVAESSDDIDFASAE